MRQVGTACAGRWMGDHVRCGRVREGAAWSSKRWYTRGAGVLLGAAPLAARWAAPAVRGAPGALGRAVVTDPGLDRGRQGARGRWKSPSTASAGAGPAGHHPGCLHHALARRGRRPPGRPAARASSRRHRPRRARRPRAASSAASSPPRAWRSSRSRPRSPRPRTPRRSRGLPPSAAADRRHPRRHPGRERPRRPSARARGAAGPSADTGSLADTSEPDPAAMERRGAPADDDDRPRRTTRTRRTSDDTTASTTFRRNLRARAPARRSWRSTARRPRQPAVRPQCRVCQRRRPQDRAARTARSSAACGCPPARPCPSTGACPRPQAGAGRAQPRLPHLVPCPQDDASSPACTSRSSSTAGTCWRATSARAAAPR